MRPAFPIAAPMLAPHCPPTKPTAEPRPRQPQTKRPTREVGRASLSLLEAIFFALVEEIRFRRA